MLYTENDIHHCFTAGLVEKAAELVHQDAVQQININQGGGVITAVVQHSENRHRVFIRCETQASGTRIKGECGCAHKQNCQHVAAALLHALRTAQNTTSVDHKHAMQNTSPSKKAAKKLQNRSAFDPKLFIIIDVVNKELRAQSVIAKQQTADAPFSNIKAFVFDRTLSSNPPRYLDDEDLGVLRQLHRSLQLGDAWARFETDSVWPILQSLVRRGRVYLRKLKPKLKLKLGVQRELQYQWVCDIWGRQRLQCTIDGVNQYALILSFGLYLDLESCACGQLTSRSTPLDVLNKLVDFPPRMHSDWIEVLQADKHDDAAYDIPPPPQYPVEDGHYEHITPLLILRSHHDNQIKAEKGETHRACLMFDYNGVLFDTNPSNTRLLDGVIKRVRRDSQQEQAYRQELLQAGFCRRSTVHNNEKVEYYQPGNASELGAQWLWSRLQREVFPRLQQQGWRIQYEHFDYQLVQSSQWHFDAKPLQSQDWFSLTLGIDVDGQRVELLPILLQLIEQHAGDAASGSNLLIQRDTTITVPFTLANGEKRLLSLPSDRVVPLLNCLLEYYNRDLRIDQSSIKLPLSQLLYLYDTDHSQTRHDEQWNIDDDIKVLSQQLLSEQGIEITRVPTGLRATLRVYQQQGLSWLQFLRKYRLGGILADDMGLGKTLQTLAYLLEEKISGRIHDPCLIVVPTSLIFNWRNEARRFAPDLQVKVWHGAQRMRDAAHIFQTDVVLTTYTLLVRDAELFANATFYALILDEAQHIKNPRSQVTRRVKSLNAQHRICLSGTPIENHLGELWSLFDFVMPGFLGNENTFNRVFRRAIEKRNDKQMAQRLSAKVKPFVMRRCKQEVASELPPKTEIIRGIVLEGKQRELYETLRLSLHRKLREEIQRQGLASSRILVLDALLKLRQVCCDPRLLHTDINAGVSESAKLQHLMEMLPELLEEGRRILVFSQFTSMLRLIASRLREVQIDYVELSGKTRDRESVVQRFQSGEVALFLISLKAGGVGLNLTAADTVIHYDPWWNPAVEQQATDRAHRIGQTQSVFVYKLICSGTLEEKIIAMQDSKSALSSDLFGKNSNALTEWDEADLDALFEPVV